MAKLTVQNLSGLAVNVKPPETVLRAVQATGTDWMHACGAKGRCTTCRMEVLAGMENLSPESAPELKYREAGRLKTKERLACQCTVTGGEVLVRVPKPVQLPHQKYT
ncbi:2Fe-2S iron-sulfur cluster-binding protein [Adhaeribacter soli]|uniref:(2Fe-2S)-binding protein n=1 Tax=Adhaeribacter soli TaxID=2607655 RepID=A0A5N1INU8_9BACT|nr:2Fe-2S iron-sulfur cluster-binding protein [Adhaeribacter soli]KAA9331205.1 (2Fe-2S)-binding protein [Adhaeribacter soli]